MPQPSFNPTARGDLTTYHPDTYSVAALISRGAAYEGLRWDLISTVLYGADELANRRAAADEVTA